MGLPPIGVPLIAYRRCAGVFRQASANLLPVPALPDALGSPLLWYSSMMNVFHPSGYFFLSHCGALPLRTVSNVHTNHTGQSSSTQAQNSSMTSLRACWVISPL